MNLPAPHPHPDQRFGGHTFAQHGDDLMILSIFDLLGIDKPSYLDIGAHHPWNISNTALLYQRGSRGINIEENPALIGAFNEHRPEDINLNVGIVPAPATQKTMPFYMLDDLSGRNTFSEYSLEKANLSATKEIILPVTTLDEVIEDNGGKWPDLLTIDIEGLDYGVLQTSKLNAISGPRLIVVETRAHEEDRMKSLMDERGYHPYCRMIENMFFVRKDDLTSLI